MDEKLKDKETLLAVDKKDNNRIKAVKGVSANGELATVDATEGNEQDFIQINQRKGILENFFSNLKREFKDPTHFQFFRAPTLNIESVTTLLKEMLKDEEGNSIFLNQSKVNPTDFEKPEQKQTQQQGPAKENEYKSAEESKIPWDQLERLGVTRQMLEEQGQLKAMLHWHKSPNLIELHPTFEGIPFDIQARLSFREQKDGTITLQIDSHLPTPQLDKSFHGVMLSDGVKKNLLENGNAGEIVHLTNNKIPCFVSLDPLTNRLEAIPLSKVTFNETLKGATLSDEQLKSLYQGKKTLVEGMISKNGKPFDGYVQFNAAKGSLDFSYDGLNRNKYQQKQEQDAPAQKAEEKQNFRIPKTLKGKELTEQQQQDLRDRKTIYVTGMKDNAGQPFNAYIRVNEKEAKLNFYKWNPDRAQKVTPDNNARAQVAVNSEGKTNEATKHLNKPIKPGQTQSTTEQEAKKKVIQNRPKGIKM